MTCHGPRLRWHLSLLRPPSSSSSACSWPVSASVTSIFEAYVPLQRSFLCTVSNRAYHFCPIPACPSRSQWCGYTVRLLLLHLQGTQLSESLSRVSWICGLRKPYTPRARHSTQLVFALVAGEPPHYYWRPRSVSDPLPLPTKYPNQSEAYT